LHEHISNDLARFKDSAFSTKAGPLAVNIAPTSDMQEFRRTVQAAREIRQRALQAGLDYQLALADLERAMGTPLK